MPELLAEAVRLARENADAGQRPFGALVVRDGEVLGTGVNTALRDSDPTAHAEVEAIRNAGRADLTGATIVASCEPCPMCQAAAAVAGISRIVYAAPKEIAAEAGFELGPLAAKMRALLESGGPLQLEHADTPGAEEPFTRFAAAQSRGSTSSPGD
jgi:guanine deaminase